jgi:signal recognition particle GTPase
MTYYEPIKILVTNQKGGVGKSTISANLAAYFALQEGLQVSLVDFDKQASSSRWTKKAPDVGIRVSQVEINYQSAGMALLSARAGVRKYSSGADISICDFTWTPAMSEDFMSDFDIVPDSRVLAPNLKWLALKFSSWSMSKREWLVWRQANKV